VLHYFAQSPFHDPTSNNAILINQATFNPTMGHLIATREAMEGRLKTMSGVEYVVAQEPAEMTAGMGTGVWVISKQRRQKRSGQPDEITPLDTYYVVGENIYMAASVADVLQSRMVCKKPLKFYIVLTRTAFNRVWVEQVHWYSFFFAQFHTCSWPNIHAAHESKGQDD
jgi:hypothetical protein